MSDRLKDKVALVTGGIRGIGKEITKLFLEEGAKVLIVDILNKKEVNPLVLNGMNYLRLDVSKEKSWLEINSYIKNRFGKLNILVNNVGINGIDSIQDPENMLLSTWAYIHSINLSSVFLGCKYAINMMKETQENCSIINISSRSGHVGVPNLSAYASSKAAIRNYTKSVALYCLQKGYNIRCNTISPAAINTDMWAHLHKDTKKFESYCSSLPMKRMGMAVEVAYAVLYLATDESLYTTGSEIIVDGAILATCGGLPK